MKTTIVIPAFNEEKRIGKVLKSLSKYPYSIIVINDGSSDNTDKVVKTFKKVELINHKQNFGQGAALKRGIRAALKNKSDIIVTFDADGQHQAKEISDLIAPIKAGVADISLGSRFLTKRTKMPFSREILLKGSVLVERILLGVKLTDAHNGFRALSRKGAQKIKIKESGMAHASEIVYQIKKNKLKYVEVPVTIEYTSDTLEKGGNTIKRSIEILIKILKWNSSF